MDIQILLRGITVMLSEGGHTDWHGEMSQVSANGCLGITLLM